MTDELNPADEKPPVLGTWRAVHGLVLAVLVVVTAAFAWIAHVYR